MSIRIIILTMGSTLAMSSVLPKGIATAGDKVAPEPIVIKTDYFHDLKEGRTLPKSLTGSVDKEKDVVVIEQKGVKVPVGVKQVIQLSAQNPFGWYSSSPGVISAGAPKAIDPGQPVKFGQDAWLYTFEFTGQKGTSTLEFEYRLLKKGAKAKWIYRIKLED